MSNTPQTFLNIINNLSANQMQKTGYAQVINAEVISLINPFTKEYKVNILGTPAIAYGIYDVIYQAGTPVAIIEAISEGSKDRYIIGASSTEGDWVYNISVYDNYDLVGEPILLQNDSGYNEIFLRQRQTNKNQYVKIKTNFSFTGEGEVGTPVNTDAKSELTITLWKSAEDDSDPIKITYNTDWMEGNIRIIAAADKKYLQESPYFFIPAEYTYISSWEYKTSSGVSAVWENTSLLLYNEVSDKNASGLFIEAPKGYKYISEDTNLELKAKLRLDYKKIDLSNKEEVEILWFRENPLVVEGHDNYDARAGAGWEQVIPSLKTE